MSYRGEVGDIVEIGRGDGGISSFEWRIRGFLYLNGKGEDRYDSPVFCACDGRWVVQMYPKGFWRESPSDWVSLILIRMDEGLPQTLDITLGIRGVEGVENKKERRQQLSSTDHACFWGRFCLRSQLREQKSRLMPGNVLILSLDMKSVVLSVARGFSNDAEGSYDCSYQDASYDYDDYTSYDYGDDDYEDNDEGGNDEDNDDDKASKSVKKLNQAENAKKRIETLVKDFGKLLSNDENTDVTVQVGGVEFQVHRNILSVRSPVLSAMFKHATSERATNRITIEDCEPEVFKEYLQYLYTGSVGLLSEQNVFLLYRVADKYLADELKEQCLMHIQDTLSVETFCDTVKVALMHRESGLLEQAIDFATENIRSIILTVEWQNFVREYPTEANEVLIKSLGPPCACRKSKPCACRKSKR